MKVIFLDIDGVLNSAAFFQRRRGCGGPAGSELASSLRDIDSAAIARLNRLTEATGAWIVVSSSWRMHRTNGQLRALLIAVGATGWVLDATERTYERTRAEQIRTWLDDHTVRDFAVIDDDDYDGLLDFGDRFIHTDGDVGLTDADVDRAIELLGVTV